MRKIQVYQSMCLISSNGHNKFHDLTSVLSEQLRKSGINNGLMLVSALHTTCAIAIQEPDRSVHSDCNLVLENVVPPHLGYEHIYEGTNNARAHQKQLLVGSSKIIPVKNNSLVLGRWQKPFLMEFFREMERRIFVTIIGE